MINSRTVEHRTAVSNIKRRMNDNAMMYYFDDLNNGRKEFSVRNKNRRTTLQRKTYLATFSQSDLYERFLILETFCAKDTFLSEQLEGIIKNKSGAVSAVENESLINALVELIKTELTPYFDIMTNEECVEIKKLLETDIKDRRTSGGIGVRHSHTLAKLKALLNVIDGRVSELEGCEESE